MRGFSLPVVLFTVSLGGALAVGGAFVTRQLATGARVVSRSAGLDGAAEEGVVGALKELEDRLPVMSQGSSLALTAQFAGDARVERWVTRTDTSVYWLVVEATSSSKPLLRRRLGIVILPGDSGLALPPGRVWSDLH